MLNFNIHYLNSDVPKLEAFNGNWIDLRCIELKVTRAETGEVETYTGDWETVSYEKGDVLFVNFGFSLDMTDTVTGEDYVANIYPRSSLFKNFGLILTNHVGELFCNINFNNNDVFFIIIFSDNTHIWS
jgi:dUTPase